MNLAVAVLVSLSLSLNGCNLRLEVRDGDVFFSFESGFDNWAARGIDAGPGGTLNWSVTPSAQLARAGASSLRFELNNFSGDAKVWIERAFRFDRSRTRRVTVRFAFASADLGSFGNFRVLAGVKGSPPETGADLTPLAREDTGNGRTADSGYQWMDKSYAFTLEPLPPGSSTSQDHLWVVIGVWGTSNAHRSYFVDSLRVTFEED